MTTKSVVVKNLSTNALMANVFLKPASVTENQTVLTNQTRAMSNAVSKSSPSIMIKDVDVPINNTNALMEVVFLRSTYVMGLHNAQILVMRGMRDVALNRTVFTIPRDAVVLLQSILAIIKTA
jgi:hypothetical protein